jgi:AcrR family transcriptional regulator
MLLDALESRLVKQALRDVTVEELSEDAGITRTRFYHYFDSKYDALAASLQRLADEMVEVYLLPGSWFVREPGQRPRAAMHKAFTDVVELYRGKHGPIVREASGDLWNAVPQVREGMESVFDRLVKITADRIEKEREIGAAPDGAPADALAKALIWGGERGLVLQLIDSRHALSAEHYMDTHLSIWMRTIYLADDPDPVD